MASNIKSKQTRSNVQAAIKNILQQLKKYKSTPENGLGIYSGLSKNNGFITEEIIPNIPMKQNYYKCSNSFHLEPFYKLLESHDKNGMIRLTGSGTEFYYIDERDCKLASKMSVVLPSNHCRGGQSQARIGR